MLKERNKTEETNGTAVLAAVSANKTTVGALALLLMASQVSAAPFSFSTGNPDGKMATLARPSSPGKIQTETADDFIIVSTNTTLISEASFTGLIPSGMPPTSVRNVEIEMYHVFPYASDTNRTLHVPTRANSPGDVEIANATRDGVPDSLDQCPGTPAGAIVDAQGCSIEQIAPCSGPASGGTWRNHGQYVSAVAHAVVEFLEQRLISLEQAEEIIVQAAESDCGRTHDRHDRHHDGDNDRDDRGFNRY